MPSFDHHLRPRQAFEPSCLSGGIWYSCGAGSRFVGCCTSDPCNSRGCSDGNLRPASFNASAYSDFPDAECDSGRFWTCATTDPPFLGCCKVNACQAEGNAGCPDEDLTAAHLPDNDALASAYSPTGGPSSTATATASASATAAPDDSGSTPTAGIVGGVIGAVVVLLVVVIGALLRRRRSKKNKEAASAAAAMDGDHGRSVSELAGGDVGSHGKGSPGTAHPPRYSSLGHHQQYAMELDGFPRKSPHDQRTPSELGAGETAPHAELPGDDASTVMMHELEGSSPAMTGTTAASTTPKSTTTSGSGSGKKGGAAAHSRGSSWSSFNERRAARRASGGSGGGGSTGTGPRGLAIVGLHPHSHVRGGSNGSNDGGGGRASPRSPSFAGGGGGGAADDGGSESGVSSLPSTPRSGYTNAYGPGAGTSGAYSDVSRLSPTYPPPIREEGGGGAGGRYRDDDDDEDDDEDDLHEGYGNGRR
ncbi:uncharacterized protein BKCO1_5800033 [Diplodia corticola]|uniref:Uncharacterized protein n=1 Tax=Diplodia corticola TaxID=236234 RepID=A0A1J9RSW9_9PEZI|nr:uncharacterized protein BKCO1_5800033 [Diplodia corticola]OJD30629.1 hypothetical protein BKCO1_5800033 [Diplodia corticola]